MTSPDPGLNRDLQDHLTAKLQDIRDWLSDDLDSTLIRDTSFRDNADRTTGKQPGSDGPIPYNDHAADAARQLHGTLRDAVLDTLNRPGFGAHLVTGVPPRLWRHVECSSSARPRSVGCARVGA